MTLPILISVPHAGLRIPPELADNNLLTPRQIAKDGDEGASTIYSIRGEVDAFVTTDIARAFVDCNRSEKDRRKDGIVKTHTCWDIPIYRRSLSEDVVEALLSRYYRPYHRQLSEISGTGVLLGLDCHTMAATAPPVAPDPGSQRPSVCLSDGNGLCPPAVFDSLVQEFLKVFEHDVRINDPFHGGYIIRSHAHELPWVQLELSRAPFLTDADKRSRVLTVLENWCTRQSS